jgi:16S rRNA A1518/A1519 N6-dimethyltransferase RsmA/KsgA/DIM1 with predicted DNA glycosylase/AP lyase activity
MLKSCCKLIGDAGILPARSRAEGILPAEEFNWPEILNQLGIDPEIRPDNLTPEQFVAIANLCSESK